MKKDTISFITCALIAFLALPGLVAGEGAYNPLAGSGYHTPSPTVAPLSVPQASASVRPPSAMTASGTLAGYDPFMDNHLEAPVTPQGLFGIPVREAEKVFRAYGAKPYSYAFGKHSRLLLSVYLVTIFFDRSRNVGEIQVEPRPPYKIIEPTARGFFLQLITRETRPDEFETVLTPSKISVKYVRSGKAPDTATSTR